MRILILVPILKDNEIESDVRREVAQIASHSVEYTVRSLVSGPASIESEFDERIASPFVLDEVVRAEREGFDAVFVSCMGDIAINAARELVRIPVVGPFQACIAVASTLGDKFGVVTTLPNVVPIFLRKAREYGLEGNLAGVRSISVPVLDLSRRRDKVLDSLARESRFLINERDADTIILGCTGLVGIAQKLQEKIGVPVLDPTPVAVKFAEMLVAIRISHSPQAFHKPPAKLRKLSGVPNLAWKSIKLEAASS
jgi:allantoin racemase